MNGAVHSQTWQLEPVTMHLFSRGIDTRSRGSTSATLAPRQTYVDCGLWTPERNGDGRTKLV